MFIAVSGFRFVAKTHPSPSPATSADLYKDHIWVFPQEERLKSLRQQKEFPERTQCRTKESQRRPSPAILQSGPL